MQRTAAPTNTHWKHSWDYIGDIDLAEKARNIESYQGAEKQAIIDEFADTINADYAGDINLGDDQIDIWKYIVGGSGDYTLRRGKTMNRRSRGYHYVKRRDGTKYRVYDNGKVGKMRPRRAGYRVRGHGDYKLSAGTTGRYGGAGAMIGGALGAALGTTAFPGIGTALGTAGGAALGYGIDKILGWGDYRIERNSLVHPNQPALFDGPEYVRIRHREYLADISSTTSFTNQSFALNPGLATSFPWLSAIADQFEQYHWNGMIWDFISTSADALNSTNTALGQVAMATDYDAADAAYSNLQQMLSTTFANSGKPSNRLMHAIECAPNATPMEWYYVRSSSVPSGKDARLYDLGNFQIATTGSQAAAVIGQLWVTYDVTFQKKQMNNILGLSLNSDHFQLSSVTNANPLGTAQSAAVSGSNLGGSTSTTKYSFPANLAGGTYLLVYSVSGNSTACTAPSLTYTNCSALSLMSGDSNSSMSNTGQTVTNFIFYTIMKITGQSASFTFGAAGTLPASVSSGDLFVTQLNGNITT